MHVAQQLRSDYFECRLEDELVAPEQLLGNWQPFDRFGLVIDEALGGLGASLLYQLAITQFYDCKPERRDAGATYPEFYIFHMGGPHGDFSHFDAWPPRKEIHLPANDPLALLEAINAHGISVLGVPEGSDGDTRVFERGPSSWAELGSARDRVRATFLYAPSGRVVCPDVVVRSSAPQTRENILGTIDIMSSVRAVRAHAADVGVTTGVMGSEDDLRWGAIAEARVSELSVEDRQRADAALQACTDAESNVLEQHYARRSFDEALERIAGYWDGEY